MGYEDLGSAVEKVDGPIPFLGVCATNYNCGKIIGDHIDSVYRVLREFDFEYVVVDNFSKDNSWEVIERKARELRNFRPLRKRCKRGTGRNIANRSSKADYIVVVDTDTIYGDLLARLIEAYFRRPELKGSGIRAGYAGIFSRKILDTVGGWGNLNCDDWDLTVRLWKAGLPMRVYPVRLGENVKEKDLASDMDFLSSRYGRLEKLTRWINVEVERLGANGRWKVDLNEVYRDVITDLEFGPPIHEVYTNLDDYTTMRRYLLFMRYKVFMALGIEETMQRWSLERRKLRNGG
ncbi:MAG: glycosyltransferase family 2 protein [Euryarchaeota archaeon]|nr:glycosyltransferase family 2 protein [Euryarchaeota archaeon]